MQKIRIGIVGGGNGAPICAIHRMLAALVGQIELVCGAFSSDPERTQQRGQGQSREIKTKFWALKTKPSKPLMNFSNGWVKSQLNFEIN